MRDVDNAAGLFENAREFIFGSVLYTPELTDIATLGVTFFAGKYLYQAARGAMMPRQNQAPSSAAGRLAKVFTALAIGTYGGIATGQFVVRQQFRPENLGIALQNTNNIISDFWQRANGQPTAPVKKSSVDSSMDYIRPAKIEAGISAYSV